MAAVACGSSCSDPQHIHSFKSAPHGGSRCSGGGSRRSGGSSCSGGQPKTSTCLGSLAPDAAHQLHVCRRKKSQSRKWGCGVKRRHQPFGNMVTRLAWIAARLVSYPTRSKRQIFCTATRRRIPVCMTPLRKQKLGKLCTGPAKCVLGQKFQPCLHCIFLSSDTTAICKQMGGRPIIREQGFIRNKTIFFSNFAVFFSNSSGIFSNIPTVPAPSNSFQSVRRLSAGLAGHWPADVCHTFRRP